MCRALEEAAQGRLEVLRRRESYEQNAKQLPALKDAFTVAWCTSSASHYETEETNTRAGVCGELLHHLAIDLVSEFSVMQAVPEKASLFLEHSTSEYQKCGRAVVSRSVAVAISHHTLNGLERLDSLTVQVLFQLQQRRAQWRLDVTSKHAKGYERSKVRIRTFCHAIICSTGTFRRKMSPVLCVEKYCLANCVSENC